MSDTYYMDIETCSEAPISVGGHRYADDPTTEITCAAFSHPGGDVWVWSPFATQTGPLPSMVWPPEYPLRGLHRGIPPDLSESILVAHNAYGFDELVWERLGEVQPRGWLDSVPLCRANALPGQLDKVATLLGIGSKGEDGTQARRLFKPSTPDHKSPRGPTGSPIHLALEQVLLRYCIRDVLLLEELCEHHLRPQQRSERPVIAADRVINRRGMRFDYSLARQLHRLLTQLMDSERQGLTEQGFDPKDVQRVTHLRGWLAKRGLELPDLRKATIQRVLDGSYFDSPEELESENPAPPQTAPTDPLVYDVLRARLNLTGITAKKLARVLEQDDGTEPRLRGLLAYHSAHSGRWGGRGVQPQNLPSPPYGVCPFSFLDSVMRGEVPPTDTYRILGAMLRLCFVAARGGTLALVDLAKIELCGLAWYAGQHDLVEVLAAGGDPYQAFADRIGTTRKVGKPAVLGCGYRMGANGFAAYCKTFGVDLAEHGITAEQVVNEFRAAYPAIVSLWSDIETTAMQAIRYGDAGQLHRITAQRHIAGGYRKVGPHLILELPSGREMVYRNARIEHRVPGYAERLGLEGVPPRDMVIYEHPRYGDTETFGGKLTENLVQAFCRDPLAEAIVRIEEHYPVVLHVHDEVVCEVPDESCLTEIIDLMIVRPTWATGMPLGAEGFCTDRYTKTPPPGAVKIERWATKETP